MSKNKLIGKSSFGRYFTVKEENVHLIPDEWQVFRCNHYARFYNDDGKLHRRYIGFKEVKSEKDVKDILKTKVTNINLLMGYFSEKL